MLKRFKRAQTKTHYLIHCPNYSNERLTLLKTLRSINGHILKKGDSKVIRILFFGKKSFNVEEDAL